MAIDTVDNLNEEEGTLSKPQPLYKLIPNVITLTAMVAGMSSIKFAIQGKWELVVSAILFATFMDAFDGAVARGLKAQSKLGAELDSLSDFMCFGVAPAFILYLWTDSPKYFGWFATLFFVIATALRLARFNITQEEKEGVAKEFFTGIPSPAGAILALLPIILSFQISDTECSVIYRYLNTPQLIYVWMLLIAYLMVSNIPTVSSKQIKVHRNSAFPILIAFMIIIIGLFTHTWPSITVISVVYLFFMPLGVISYYREVKKAKKLS